MITAIHGTGLYAASKRKVEDILAVANNSELREVMLHMLLLEGQVQLDTVNAYLTAQGDLINQRFRELIALAAIEHQASLVMVLLGFYSHNAKSQDAARMKSYIEDVIGVITMQHVAAVGNLYALSKSYRNSDDWPDDRLTTYTLTLRQLSDYVGSRASDDKAASDQ